MRRALALAAFACAGCGGGAQVAQEAPPAHVGDRVGTIPNQGFAVQRRADVELIGLDGKVHARLRRVRLEAATPGVVMLIDSGHKRLVFDPDEPRLRRFRLGDFKQAPPDACTAIGRGFSLCNSAHGSSLRRAGRRIAGMPEPQASKTPPAGSWRWGWPSPDGRTLLLQWSGECEVPIAFFADARRGRLRPVTGERDWRRAPESTAFGWLPDGRAVVDLPVGACGNGTKRPGYYAIDPRTGRATYLRDRSAAYWSRD